MKLTARGASAEARQLIPVFDVQFEHSFSMKSSSGRDVRVVLLSVTVSVALGIVVALSFAILLGGRPEHWSVGELVREAPAAIGFGLSTSAPITVPLGLIGGWVAVLALRGTQHFPRERWMVRGSVIGAAIGFLPFAVWDILFEHLSDALVFPVLCGVGGACSGAVMGNILSRFHRPSVAGPPPTGVDPASRA
jgi:hypothetical protein